MKKADRITQEVRALKALDLHGLRDEWRKRKCIKTRPMLLTLLLSRYKRGSIGSLSSAKTPNTHS